jgi:hypothetical protein
MFGIKERPILLSAPMVRAILDGRKTVTRRPVKGCQISFEDTSVAAGERHRWMAIAQRDPHYGFGVFGATEAECAKELEECAPSPYGRRGERLWVRETWYCDHDEVMRGPYLGMYRDEFNKTVRPNVREFPIGKQGIGFDRIELDQWADAYIESMAIEKAANQDNNQPRSGRQGASKWREKQSPASTRGTEFGTSTKSSEVSDFRKALDQAKGRKRSST